LVSILFDEGFFLYCHEDICNGKTNNNNEICKLANQPVYGGLEESGTRVVAVTVTDAAKKSCPTANVRFDPYGKVPLPAAVDLLNNGVNKGAFIQLRSKRAQILSTLGHKIKAIPLLTGPSSAHIRECSAPYGSGSQPTSVNTM
jgi:hypothetical protein